MFTAKAPNKNVLNELPDAEAELLCHAKHYERNANGPAPELDCTREILKQLYLLKQQL